MNNCFIYGLYDPRTGEIRYVGKTTLGMYRPKRHGTSWMLVHNKTHRTNWIKSLIANGIRYGIIVLEYCEESMISSRERDWIAWGRNLGWRLTNHTDGGEGVSGYHFNDEQKKLIGSYHRGKKMSPEACSKISKGVSKPVTDTTTGITYYSASEAAKVLSLNQGLIWRCLVGKQKQTKGHSFIRADVALFNA